MIRRTVSTELREPKGPSSVHGFTLIEILVTITIFVAALSVIVTSLYGSVHTWRGVRTHQTREAELTRAFEQLSDDMRNAVVIGDDVPPLKEATDSNGAQYLTLTSLDSRRRQLSGIGSDWLQLDYRLAQSDDGKSTVLKRTVQPMVAQALRGTATQDVLLTNVSSLRFEFGTSDGVVAAWNDAKRLPSFVRITLVRKPGGTVSKTFWIPTGALGGAA